MNSYDFLVDTKPMAEKIEQVGHRVSKVTDAVIHMQTTVISAEEAAADKICNDVNRGFYSLIRSQISQKIAKLAADVESKMIEMRQQSDAVRAFRLQMERDYNMIAARYTKLFDSLNKSLRIRIFELDKYPIMFSKNISELLHNRVKRNAATVPMNQSESVSGGQSIVSSKLRANGHRLINRIKTFVADSNLHTKRIKNALGSYASRNSSTLWLPFAASESVSLDTNKAQFKLFFPQSNSPTFDGELTNRVTEAFHTSTNFLEWVEMDEKQKSEVMATFEATVSSADIPEKVKLLMKKLLNDSNLATLAGG